MMALKVRFGMVQQTHSLHRSAVRGTGTVGISAEYLLCLPSTLTQDLSRLMPIVQNDELIISTTPPRQFNKQTPSIVFLHVLVHLE